MAKWIKPVEIDDIKDGKKYFIARRSTGVHGISLFWSRPMHGNDRWTVKAGIALRYTGDDEFREALRKNPIAIAVEVPADADQRWRARKPAFSRR